MKAHLRLSLSMSIILSLSTFPLLAKSPLSKKTALNDFHECLLSKSSSQDGSKTSWASRFSACSKTYRIVPLSKKNISILRKNESTYPKSFLTLVKTSYCSALKSESGGLYGASKLWDQLGQNSLVPSQRYFRDSPTELFEQTLERTKKFLHKAETGSELEKRLYRDSRYIDLHFKWKAIAQELGEDTMLSYENILAGSSYSDVDDDRDLNEDPDAEPNTLERNRSKSPPIDELASIPLEIISLAKTYQDEIPENERRWLEAYSNWVTKKITGHLSLNSALRLHKKLSYFEHNEKAPLSSLVFPTNNFYLRYDFQEYFEVKSWPWLSEDRLAQLLKHGTQLELEAALIFIFRISHLDDTEREFDDSEHEQSLLAKKRRDLLERELLLITSKLANVNQSLKKIAPESVARILREREVADPDSCIEIRSYQNLHVNTFGLQSKQSTGLLWKYQGKNFRIPKISDLSLDIQKDFSVNSQEAQTLLEN